MYLEIGQMAVMFKYYDQKVVVCVSCPQVCDLTNRNLYDVLRPPQKKMQQRYGREKNEKLQFKVSSQW